MPAEEMEAGTESACGAKPSSSWSGPSPGLSKPVPQAQAGLRAPAKERMVAATSPGGERGEEIHQAGTWSCFD